MTSLTLALCLTSCAHTPLALPETYLIEASDDVWVYPHASDPGKDAYLRVWGLEGRAVAEKGEAPDDFSWSYLSFGLAVLPKQYVLKEATLSLFQSPDPGYTPADAKAAPLEVRTLTGEFDERTWNYGLVAKVLPGASKEAILASGYPEKWQAGANVPIVINLMPEKGAFPAFLSKLVGQVRPIFQFALTSRINPAEGGRSAVYKVFSKEGPKGTHPVLKLVIERK
jgi:hypothetical protein